MLSHLFGSTVAVLGTRLDTDAEDSDLAAWAGLALPTYMHLHQGVHTGKGSYVECIRLWGPLVLLGSHQWSCSRATGELLLSCVSKTVLSQCRLHPSVTLRHTFGMAMAGCIVHADNAHI